jgi:hypothetical protein
MTLLGNGTSKLWSHIVVVSAVKAKQRYWRLADVVSFQAGVCFECWRAPLRQLTAREIFCKKCNEKESLAWVVDAQTLWLKMLFGDNMELWLFEAGTKHVEWQTPSQRVAQFCTQIALLRAI